MIISLRIGDHHHHCALVLFLSSCLAQSSSRATLPITKRTQFGDSHSSLFTSSPHRTLHEERHGCKSLAAPTLSYSYPLRALSSSLSETKHFSLSPVSRPAPHPASDPVPGKPSSSGLDSEPNGPGPHSTRSTMLKLMFDECSLTGPGFWLPCCCYSVGAFS